MPTAGQLKDVLLFLAPDRSQTRPSGSKIVRYQPVKQIRGEVVDTRGWVREAHEQQVGLHTHRVKWRARTVEALADWVIDWKGVRLQIDSMTPGTGQDTDFIVAYCKSIGPATPDTAYGNQ